jgi:hypothetical protein
MFEQELNKYWKTVVDTIQAGVILPKNLSEKRKKNLRHYQ